MAEMMADSMDKPGFPRNGCLGYVRWRGAATWLGSDAAAGAVEMDLSVARSWGKHTARFRADRSVNLDPDSEEPYIYRLGGFLNLSGFGTNNLVGTERVLGQVQYLYQMKKVLRLPWYAGTAVEWGGTRTPGDSAMDQFGFWAGSLFTALDTGLGPLYLAYSQASAGVRRVSLTIGMAL
jgi:NTE family protein